MDKLLLEDIVHSWVDRFVIFEDERYINNDETKYAQEQVFNRIMELYNTNEEEINSIADEIGINLRYNKTGKNVPSRVKDRHNFFNKYSTEIPKGQKRSVYDFSNYTEIAKEITNKVLKVANLLKNGGYIDDKSRFLVTKLKKDRKDYKEILNMKDFIDRWGLTFLYDNNKSFGSNQSEKRFGITFNDDGSYNLDNFSIDTISDAQRKSWVKDNETRKMIGDARMQEFAMLKNIVDTYFETKYGMTFKVKDIPSFSVGNSKVQNALIVNFVSAHRCPAWNTCLVKHACYAKGDEIKYPNSKQSNDKKNLMWLLADRDDELMRLMYMQLRSFAIDYKAVCKDIKCDYNKEFKNILEMPFSAIKEHYPELLDVIKKNKRVPFIRLNENGDFLSSNFLKKIDEMAGEFKLVDITTAAYTCRNFANYESIENIIINASRDYINSGSGNTIARYFFAIPEKLFKLYDETYVNGNKKIFTIKDNTVGHNPLPLYDFNTGKANGNYYYKCPCGRTDFKPIEEGKKKKQEDDKPKINCYQCNLCYQPKDTEINGKYYVFVIAHGSNKNELNNETYIKEHVGICESEARKKFKDFNKINNLEQYSIPINNNYDSMPMAAKGVKTDAEKGLQESIDTNQIIAQNMRREAFRTIGINAVGSMNEKINEITRLNEMKEDFFDNLKKLD